MLFLSKLSTSLQPFHNRRQPMATLLVLARSPVSKEDSLTCALTPASAIFHQIRPSVVKSLTSTLLLSPATWLLLTSEPHILTDRRLPTTTSRKSSLWPNPSDLLSNPNRTGNNNKCWWQLHHKFNNSQQTWDLTLLNKPSQQHSSRPNNNTGLNQRLQLPNCGANQRNRPNCGLPQRTGKFWSLVPTNSQWSNRRLLQTKPTCSLTFVLKSLLPSSRRLLKTNSNSHSLRPNVSKNSLPFSRRLPRLHNRTNSLSLNVNKNSLPSNRRLPTKLLRTNRTL